MKRVIMCSGRREQPPQSMEGGTTMEHEWKKQEKELYLPGTKPVLVNVPEQKFIMISGQVAERLGVLYSLAYAVRMMPKSGASPR